MAVADPVIYVTKGNSKLVELERPAHTIVIGSPDVVKVTIINNSRIVLTANALGSTNVMSLSADGKVQKEFEVVVNKDAEHTATIYRRSEAEELVCHPNCRASEQIAK